MARSARLESGFQDRLISTLKELFPGCMIFKMISARASQTYFILYGKKWASLSVKGPPRPSGSRTKNTMLRR